MIGVDTNILVRLLTNDDPLQAQRVAELLDNHEIFVPRTVMLETEWILRYAYQLPKPRIILSLKMLLGLPQVMVEDPELLIKAIKWYEEGFDFADALHLASSLKTEAFASFDRKLAKKASSLNTIIITP